MSIAKDSVWPYRLIQQLGKGASATAWLAEDTAHSRRVVLKVGHTLAERARLAEEAERLCAVGSPLLSEVLDAGIVPSSSSGVDAATKDAPYIALTWFEGVPLDQIGHLDDDERLAIATAIARDIGEALADLHAAGTAHGDVKPANLIVARGDSARTTRVRLVDLGLAAQVATIPVVGGTPRYLAPESFEASAGASAGARDLWALGLTLAELLDPQLRGSEISAGAIERLQAFEPMGTAIAALLAKTPAARPGAAWVALRARAALNQSASSEERRERWQRAVQSSYLATRRRELSHAAQGMATSVALSGVAASWLEASCAIFRRIGALRGAHPTFETQTLSDLASFEQQRWLLRLIGSAAARFPRLTEQSDSQLATRLLDLTERRDPRAIRFADLLETGVSEPLAAHVEPLALAAELSADFPSKLAVELGEYYVQAHEEGRALRPILATALRRRGDWAQALVILDEIHDEAALAAAAEISRRMGDRDAALGRLLKLEQLPLRHERSLGVTTRARLLYDGGDDRGAAELLDTLPESTAAFEIRALLALQRGALREASAAAHNAAACAKDAEQLARAESVLGSIYHARGDARAALKAFRNASAYANRAGVVVEEAVYSTNVAAAATDAGEIAEAVDAARRAILLFEHLGRAEDAARAALSLACAYAVAGAHLEAVEWFHTTLGRARAAGDRRCQAFVHLGLSDLPSLSNDSAREHAQQAWDLLESAVPDDRLRAASRLLRWDARLDPLAYDEIARSSETAADARFDWWGKRALKQLGDPEPSFDTTRIVLMELLKLIPISAAVGCRGPSLAQGATLAMRAGEGDSARRLVQAGLECVKQLHQGTPEELRSGVRALPWVIELQRPVASALLPEQIVDIENLVRSLGSRDRLRPLLDQVLDALVLWTGVERGLLLLLAPGGKLVPRAARNLARGDITGEQLHLSESLAQRALQTREPVVAIDATGELSELHQSVHNLGLRSVLAVPLLARGEPLGVVYLDDRTRRGAFGPAELNWVRLVATLAAVAISEARDQLVLRRSVRRARNAENRVASLLAQRDVELEVAQRELARTKERETRFDYDAIIGRSPAITEMLKLVDRVTVSDIPVLVTGESGSGKELIARAIHKNGARSRGVFVSENCASIPETLLESTLFGHTRGAFTGASQARAGLFEVASGGTLFLDEIGEMSLGMQAKLLRALETGEIRPVGAERTRRVDVRIIAATHRNLEQMVERGTFRKDLYYRLNVISVRSPPLRERREDIPFLFAHFFAKYGSEPTPKLTERAWEAALRYDWPGNVRELENETRRLLVMADERVDVEHLSPVIRAAKGGARPLHELDLRARVDLLEMELVVKALDRTSGNQTRSAELLGISRFGLQKMLKRLNIDVQSLRAGRSPSTELTETR